MLRELGPLSPAMSNWMLLDLPDPKFVLLADAAPNMAAFVEHNVVEDDDGEPDPESGYCVIVKGSEIASDTATSDSIKVSVTAGSTWRNSAEFEVGAVNLPKDFSLITYPIYRGALEAMVSAWPCPWAIAYTFCADVPPVDASTSDHRSPFDVAWIGYLSAPLAAGLAASADLTFELTPGGGVIVSAVQDLIDPSDRDHMRRSRLLEAIMVERVGVVRQVTPVSHQARVGPY
jgi:hypothetical protein